MEQWITYKLGKIAECSLGKMLDQRKNKGKPQMYLGNIAVRWGSFNINPSQTMLFEDHELTKYKLEINDIVICEGGEPGRCAMWKSKDTIYIQKALHRVRVNRNIADPFYVYYYITYLVKSHLLDSYFTGTTIKHLPREQLLSIDIKIPNLATQKKIGNILENIDSKIDLNRRINDNLEQQAQALFKSWFVDFEPFKNGKFVESEIGMIPEGWKVGNLLDVAELSDSKRKPLSAMERSNMNKVYPYYGATSIMDYVDDYLFDGIYLLMGEDGSVMTENGFPYLQYVSGKFWVNNHAHIMQGKNAFTTEMLHCLLFRKNISEFVTGAVQAKISQNNMKRIKLAIAPANVLDSFSKLLDSIYSQIRQKKKESDVLCKKRDLLLPKLMSGKIKINDLNS